jgi:hypothetical protein
MHLCPFLPCIRDISDYLIKIGQLKFERGILNNKVKIYIFFFVFYMIIAVILHKHCLFIYVHLDFTIHSNFIYSLYFTCSGRVAFYFARTPTRTHTHLAKFKVVLGMLLLTRDNQNMKQAKHASHLYDSAIFYYRLLHYDCDS